MSSKKLINNSNNTPDICAIKVKDIEFNEGYLYIALNNGQKILTNGHEIYDISSYEHFIKILLIGDKLCAVLSKWYTTYVIDLNTKEVLFKDDNAMYVNKQDDRSLHVIMNNGENPTIYDIETKKYLPAPKNYKFEHSLEPGLYVFREEHDSNIEFYDYKRCVITSNGDILLNDVNGWIDFNNGHLIITKENELQIVSINDQKKLDVKKLVQNERIIANPKYYNGNIIIVEENTIKILNTNLEVLNKYNINNLQEVLEIDIVNNTLKLLLPHTINGEQINKHLFINLKNGKMLSHIRIEGYPFWVPTAFIGYDNLEDGVTTFHVYDANFNPITSIEANSYKPTFNDKENIFTIETECNGETKKQLLHTELGTVTDLNYDYIHFDATSPYGYGVNYSNNTIDFFDDRLNIIIPNFEFQKYKLHIGNFGFFIVNDFICISNSYHDSHGITHYRKIICKSNGELIFDDVDCKCYPIGDYIQIIRNDKSEFLNTLTGVIETFELNLPINEKGRIDFEKLTDLSKANTPLIPQLLGNQTQNIRKLIPSSKIDN